jgi:hypothetical protein
MRIGLVFGLLVSASLATELQIARLEIWENTNKSKKLFSYKEGAKLSPAVVLPDQSYAEVEITDKAGIKMKAAQVAFMFGDETTGTPVMGTHPSVQVPLRASSAGGYIFRGDLSMSRMRTTNPKGGLFAVTLLVGDDSGHLMHSLGRVTIPASKERLNSVGDGIKELSDFLPLPVIEHTFRPPAVTANPLITTVFTVMCIAVPVLMFLSGVRSLDFNLKGLSNITSLVFASGAAAFAGLMALFFGALNLVQTVAGVVILLVPLSFVGNRVLSQLRTSGELSS